MRFPLAIVASLCIAGAAHALGGGINGFSGKPPPSQCTDCHGPTPGISPTVTLTGAAMINAGDTATYTLTIDTESDQRCVGFDIATSDGTLGTVAQSVETQILNGEVVHTRNWGKGKQVQIQLTLAAPLMAESLTLYASGLDTDCMDTESGDGFAATMLAVTVAGTNADFAGFVPPDLAMAGPAGRVDEPKWACACTVGGARSRASPLGPLAVALLTLVFTRRVAVAKNSRRRIILRFAAKQLTSTSR
jgi:hypothetical protein